MLLILLALSLAAWAQQPITSSIVINGKKIKPEPPAVLVDDEIMLPLRSVFKAMGANVQFKDKEILAQRGSHTLSFKANEKQATIDNEKVKLAVPAQVISGATYVPLELVARAFGDRVSYDKKTDTIAVEPAQGHKSDEPPGEEVPADKLTVLSGKLKLLVVGNQGAILKVWTEDQKEVAYYRGLDDRDTAPYSNEDQMSLANSLGMAKADLEQAALDVVNGYNKLPKKNALAFLGLVYSMKGHSPLKPSAQTDIKIKKFLLKALKEDKSVVMRRQACLSLAVAGSLDPEVLSAVLDFYSGSENLWETFPVQQFFQYHADEIRALPNFAEVRTRAEAVNSLYKANILSYLDGT